MLWQTNTCLNRQSITYSYFYMNTIIMIFVILMFSFSYGSGVTKHKHIHVTISTEFNETPENNTAVFLHAWSSCTHSLVDSDNRTVILAKPLAQRCPAPHIFHLTIFSWFASFPPLVFCFCSGELKSEGAFIYNKLSWPPLHLAKRCSLLFLNVIRYFFLLCPDIWEMDNL